MRIGYLFRGFLGDVKLGPDLAEVSTPDGNATYSWALEHEAQRRRYQMIPLGENLDAPAAGQMGGDLFSSFSRDLRARSYERMMKRGWSRLSDRRFPDLDVVLVEWRWPIPGRNTPQDYDKPGYQRDLERQTEVLLHYGELGVPIIVWDLDHKLTDADRDAWSDAGVGFHVIETSVRPSPGRIRVEPPCILSELLQHDIDERVPSYHLGYIGSRYERDETIDKWIGPITPQNTHRARFWGKWETREEVEARWPGIVFSGRIGVRGFREAYSRVAGVPLLAKRSYYDSGFITPRPWEAILFGSVPIGLAEHHGIDQYCEYVAWSPEHLLEIATWMRNISPIRRRVLREDAAHRLSHMDARGFMDVIEGLVGDAVAGDVPEATAKSIDEEEGNDGKA